MPFLDSQAREILTVNEVVDLLKVSRRTIYNWINKGALEVVRTPGGNPRIYKDSLLKVDRRPNPSPLLSR